MIGVYYDWLWGLSVSAWVSGMWIAGVITFGPLLAWVRFHYGILDSPAGLWFFLGYAAAWACVAVFWPFPLIALPVVAVVVVAALVLWLFVRRSRSREVASKK